MSERRIEYPDAFYHVVQRGNNREKIFLRDADRYRYLNNLSVLKAKYDFMLLGYVLMDNHYHLFLKTGKIPLQKIIFYQNMIYSRYFNKAHDRTGHLYGGRYKAYLVLDEKYLFSVLRYIHWNPCKAGLCSKPEDYRWSSDSYYRNNNLGIVDTDFILKIFSDNQTTAVNKYKRLMQISPGEEEVAELKAGPVIGVTAAKKNQDIELAAHESTKKESVEKPSLDQILREIVINEDDLHLIKNGSRQRRLSSYKIEYYKKAAAYGYTYEEIGSNINISAAAVAKAF